MRRPTVRRIVLSAITSLAVGLGVVSLLGGFSPSPGLRLLQGVAVFVAGAVLLGGVVLVVMVRLAGWREPESEQDFEAIVERAERLAADGGQELPGEWWDEGGLTGWPPAGLDAGARSPTGRAERRDADARRPRAGDGGLGGGRRSGEGWGGEDFPPTQDRAFRALVRSAIDELPLEFHRALEHVAIVVCDGGREQNAYGLYQGDTVARDFFHDRIVIFRDTLVRDFGHDRELLRAQVTRTVRHELAHHLGWGEKGVRGLGL